MTTLRPPAPLRHRDMPSPAANAEGTICVLFLSISHPFLCLCISWVGPPAFRKAECTRRQASGDGASFLKSAPLVPSFSTLIAATVSSHATLILQSRNIPEMEATSECRTKRKVTAPAKYESEMQPRRGRSKEDAKATAGLRSRRKRKARKAATVVPLPANDTLQTVRGISKEMLQSPFLGLPAELRNAVYEYVALGSPPAMLRPNGKGQLLSNSPLMRVSRQVRDEYTSALYVAAPLSAIVKDMDFSHIVTFLNKLSERELSVLPSLTKPPLTKSSTAAVQRQIVIRLHVTKHCPSRPEGLSRWLVRCGHPTKKGTQLAVSYVARNVRDFTVRECDIMSTWLNVDSIASGEFSYIEQPVRRVLSPQLEMLRKMEKAGLGEDRVYDELKKIAAALGDPQSGFVTRKVLEWCERRRKLDKERNL